MNCLPKLVSNKEISDQVNYEIVEIRKNQMRLQKRIEPMVVSAAAQVHYVKSSWFFPRIWISSRTAKIETDPHCICSDYLALVKFLMCLTWKQRRKYELKCSQSWFYKTLTFQYIHIRILLKFKYSEQATKVWSIFHSFF